MERIGFPALHKLTEFDETGGQAGGARLAGDLEIAMHEGNRYAAVTD